jgi:hypothetical protein
MTRFLRIGLPVAAALVLGSCGGDGEHANEPRPATAINVTAAITPDKVTVSPRAFGAGPVVLIIANVTGQAHRLTVESASSGPGIRQRTAPINPNGTGTLRLDIPRGRYTVSVDGDRIVGTRLRVGAERPSSSDTLLTP